mgnify:FL=1
MKKVYVILLTVGFIITSLMPIGAETCTHVQDNKCGFNPITEKGYTHNGERDGHSCNPRVRSGCAFCDD